MTTNADHMPSSQQQQAPPPPERSWSIMDFETDAALYGAMESCTRNEWILQNPDEETTHAQSLDEEINRLRTLRYYLILDSERESRFERITGLTARIFNVPIALVSLIDLGRQWFMSNRGLGDVRETPRSIAFCAHAIMSTQDMLVVNDATKDIRFMTNPLVTGEPHIRFYAGVPLVSPEGYKLGTLCIIDRRPRPGLSLLEKQNLRELAALVVETMVQRRADIERSRQNTSKIIACTAHDLLTPLSSVQLNLSLLMDDKNTWNSMTPYHKDLIQTSYSCSDVMRRICQHAISSFRGGDDPRKNGAGQWKGHKKATGIKRRMMMDDDSEEEEDDDASFTEEDANILVISRLVESLRLVIDAYPKVVPISFEVDDDVPPAIISSDLNIFRSAINYLTNACNSTKKGSIKLRVSTKNGVVTNDARTADVLLFECIDTGSGVDVKKYPTMLNAFKDAKLHSKRNINNASSGLGLCSVANNISALGGDYGFRPRYTGRSTFGNLSISDGERMGGSVFWFSIPLCLPTEKILARYRPLDQNIRVKKEEPTPDAMISSMPPVPPQEISSLSSCSKTKTGNGKKNKRGLKSPKMNDRGQKRKGSSVTFEFEDETIGSSQGSISDPSKPTERTKRALVIDDSLTIRKSIDRALTKEGFSVTQACNGMEGLEKMQHYLFDLCFCDFLMPVMDGLDCVQRYRQWEVKHRSWFEMYIIGISAHASQTDAERGLQVGMDKFFPKPLPLKTIKEICQSPEITAKSQALDKTYNTSKDGRIVFTTEFMDPNSVFEDSSVSSAGNSRTASLPVCLIAMAHKSKEISICIERRGYGISWVHNGDEALKLLKMRNWDVVLLDDDLPKLTGLSCVSRFREWEAVNRIARQNHMYIISENFISGTNVDNNIYPYGFDGALGKPVVMANLVQILESAAAVADTHDFLM